MLVRLFDSNRPYVKPEDEENIKKHRYQGTMASWYYHKIQSPMCDYLVTLCPATLPPNVITVTGFLCVFVCVVTMGLLFGL